LNRSDDYTIFKMVLMFYPQNTTHHKLEHKHILILFKERSRSSCS